MSADQTVDQIMSQLADSFKGLEAPATQKIFRDIMFPLVSAFGEAVRQSVIDGDGGAKGPKKLTNFTLFGMEWRKSHPDIKDGAFKKIAADWKKLSKDQKAEWKAKVTIINKEAEEEYVKTFGSLPTKGRRRLKAKRLTSFQVFVAEFREAHKNTPQGDMLKEAGVEWGTKSDEQKGGYKAQADELNEKAKIAFDEELKTNPLPASLQGKIKKPKVLKPVKPSGYLLYGKEWRKKNAKKVKGDKALKATEVMKEIGKAWKKLSDTQKKKHNKQADKEYEKTVKTFLETNPDCEWTQNYLKSQEASA